MYRIATAIRKNTHDINSRNGCLCNLIFINVEGVGVHGGIKPKKRFVQKTHENGMVLKLFIYTV